MISKYLKKYSNCCNAFDVMVFICSFWLHWHFVFTLHCHMSVARISMCAGSVDVFSVCFSGVFGDGGVYSADIHVSEHHSLLIEHVQCT